MIRIAIADDHKIVREGICGVIKNFEKTNGLAQEAMQVSLEAANGRELIDNLVPSNLPDIILMDLQMPILSGLEATKLIVKQFPTIKVIMLTMHDETQFILHALKLGAKSYLLKDVEPEELKTAIIEVYHKGFYFNDLTSQTMIHHIGKGGEPKIKILEDITKQEMKVLELICWGLTTKEVADKLFVVPKTIEGHRENIRAKMGVRNTAEMIICAIQNGLVDVNSIKLNLPN